jgi:hypothetical protein
MIRVRAWLLLITAIFATTITSLTAAGADLDPYEVELIYLGFPAVAWSIDGLFLSIRLLSRDVKSKTGLICIGIDVGAFAMLFWLITIVHSVAF